MKPQDLASANTSVGVAASTEGPRSGALLQAGALQSAILNSANFSSIATDEKGVIQIFNVGAERMLGYAAADVLNTITPADISDPLELIARAKALSAELGTAITPGFEALVFKASRGIEDIYELTYIRKDGSRFPAVVSVTALRDAQGGIIGYLLIGTDNTARKQVEEEQKKLDQRLRDQQFYTRSLIESNIDALMTTDPLGIITDVNRQMEALTGCTRDELIGAPFKDYFTDPERAEAGIRLVLSEKKATDYELTARARDGKTTVVSYNASTFYDRDRKLQGVFAAARDVTERKRFEQALQEANVELENAKSAAEKANRAKSDFLSSMSHELRTPLNAILGFSELLGEQLAPVMDPAQHRYLQHVRDGGQHLLGLINGVLDLAKVEAGRLELHPEVTQLASLVGPTLAAARASAETSGIDFQVTLAPEAVVRVDPDRVRQILYNLLSNAVKFTPPGGTVAFRASLSDAALVFEVQDTGIGIPPDQQGRVFGVFERLHEGRSEAPGTGLGLAITKQLVTLQRGSITFVSQDRVGTTFRVVLPDARVEVIRGDRVLIVEDAKDSADLMVALVLEAGLRSEVVTTAAEAIDAVLREPPLGVVLDLRLPDARGESVLANIKADLATRHIPVLVVSVEDDDGRSRSLGADDHLTKPIDRRRVGAWLQGLRERQEATDAPAVS